MGVGYKAREVKSVYIHIEEGNRAPGCKGPSLCLRFKCN